MTTKYNETLDSISIDGNNNTDSDVKRLKTTEKEVKLCIHICEKKKRQCKFNALKN